MEKEGSAWFFCRTSIHNSSKKNQVEAMTKLLRGLGAAVTFSAHMAATPIFGPKISNFLHTGALLVATSLLSMRISFLLIIGQRMAGLWAKKACEAAKFIGSY